MARSMTVLRSLWLRVLRAFLRSVGRSSTGIRLALDTGMTSGKTLDYVYRDQPSGRHWLGRWIDRRFLRDRKSVV